MGLFNHYPFKRGDIISDGTIRYIVNSIYKNDKDEFMMLVDTYLWSEDHHIIYHCKEVFPKGFYKIK